MGDYDWILRAERAKTKKPKGQYLYEEYDNYDRLPDGGDPEYDWRKRNESPIRHRHDTEDEPRIDIQGSVRERMMEEDEN